MVRYNKLFESADGDFILKLKSETIGFDFENGLRSMKLSVLAANLGNESVNVTSDGARGSIEIFGKLYLLPEAFSVGANSETEIFAENITDINYLLYKNEAGYTVRLNYISDIVGLKAAKIRGRIEFPEIPKKPSYEIVEGWSLTVGEMITFKSSLLDDGFKFALKVYDDFSLVDMKELSKENNTLYIDPSWARFHPESEQFVVTFVINAYIGNITLPEASNERLYCNVAEDDGLPAAAVTTDFLYDDSVSESFGKAITNRTSLQISVENYITYYGANVSNTIYALDGKRIYNQNPCVFPITTDGTHSWQVFIIDTRNKVREYSGTFVSSSYGPPEFEASVDRIMQNDAPTEDINFLITPIKLYEFEGKNEYFYSYRYRNCADDVFSGWISAESGILTTVSAGMELNSMYELQIRASDLGGQSTVQSYMVSCTRTDLHVGRGRIGFGKKAEEFEKVVSAWDIECDGDILLTSANGEKISLRAVCEKLEKIVF